MERKTYISFSPLVISQITEWLQLSPGYYFRQKNELQSTQKKDYKARLLMLLSFHGRYSSFLSSTDVFFRSIFGASFFSSSPPIHGKILRGNTEVGKMLLGNGPSSSFRFMVISLTGSKPQITIQPIAYLLQVLTNHS